MQPNSAGDSHVMSAPCANLPRAPRGVRGQKQPIIENFPRVEQGRMSPKSPTVPSQARPTQVHVFLLRTSRVKLKAHVCFQVSSSKGLGLTVSEVLFPIHRCCQNHPKGLKFATLEGRLSPWDPQGLAEIRQTLCPSA